MFTLALLHSCLHAHVCRAPTCSHGVDECQECVGGLDVEDAAHRRHTLTQRPQDGDGGEGKRSRGVELGTQVVHWPRVQRPGNGEGNKGYVGKDMCTCVHGNQGYQKDTAQGEVCQWWPPCKQTPTGQTSSTSRSESPTRVKVEHTRSAPHAWRLTHAHVPFGRGRGLGRGGTTGMGTLGPSTKPPMAAAAPPPPPPPPACAPPAPDPPPPPALGTEPPRVTAPTRMDRSRLVDRSPAVQCSRLQGTHVCVWVGE